MEGILIGIAIGLGLSLLVLTIFNVALNNDMATKVYKPIFYVLATALCLFLLIIKVLTLGDV